MARYVLVETRDPFDSHDTTYYYNLAKELAEKGHKVTLFLVQNGVLSVRKAASKNPLMAIVGGKVEVLADAFSLRERAIGETEKSDDVKVAEIGDLVDLIMAEDDTKVMWH